MRAKMMSCTNTTIQGKYIYISLSNPNVSMTMCLCASSVCMCGKKQSCLRHCLFHMVYANISVYSKQTSVDYASLERGQAVPKVQC